MDVLDKLVELGQIRGSIDVHCRFQGGWYVRHPPERGSGLAHIVTEGSGYMQADGATRTLEAGDVVFFPRIPEHIISSEHGCDNRVDAPASRRSGAFKVKERQGEGAALNLFCARFEYDDQADLMAALPDTVVLKLPQQTLVHLSALLRAEAAAPEHGAELVVDALATVLLVLIVRSHLLREADNPPENLLTGWRNPRLFRLVQAVLNAPERPWRIDEMAALAKVSRAQLMRLFKQKAGISPHAFVNRIRLQQAAVLLKRSAQPVLSVALSVGFQSETHFGRAFKKQYGVTPGGYRKNSAGKPLKPWHWEI